jgi:hypothetical protein
MLSAVNIISEMQANLYSIAMMVLLLSMLMAQNIGIKMESCIAMMVLSLSMLMAQKIGV